MMRPITSYLITFSTLSGLSSANSVRYYYQPEGKCQKAFVGCEGLGPRMCCVAGDTPGFTASISHKPGDSIVGWYGTASNPCDLPVCTAQGSGNVCCNGGSFPRFSGGSFYNDRLPSGEQDLCNSTAQVNIFGFAPDVNQAQFLQISNASLPAGSDFDTLRLAFKKVTPGREQAWLQQNGAVMVMDTSYSQPMNLYRAPFRA